MNKNLTDQQCIEVLNREYTKVMHETDKFYPDKKDEFSYSWEFERGKASRVYEMEVSRSNGLVHYGIVG